MKRSRVDVSWIPFFCFFVRRGYFFFTPTQSSTKQLTPTSKHTSQTCTVYFFASLSTKQHRKRGRERERESRERLPGDQCLLITRFKFGWEKKKENFAVAPVNIDGVLQYQPTEHRLTKINSTVFPQCCTRQIRPVPPVNQVKGHRAMSSSVGGKLNPC